ncbi:MAG TPA: GNAT family N-acetyltransferase [Syntrophales bacterium]|nr:GNAT family N-acetyltransferase [Syntrophales bacterium]
MPTTLEILNPLDHEEWDTLLPRNDSLTFFHTAAWAKTLHESYRYNPVYVTKVADDRFHAIIPMMEINSHLTGKRGVSLPFTDYCEPIIDENVSFQDVFGHIISYGKKKRWKYLELRGGERFLQDISPSTQFFGHTLDLSQGEGQVFSKLRSNIKRNIKKAQKESVSVDFFNTSESIEEYYRLHCLTRKRQGVPPQPLYFFRKIHDHVISRNLGFITLASYRDRNIAGAVFFHYRKKLLFKFGASDTEYQQTGANNLIMQEAIRWGCQNGYTSLCFGRTDLEHQGLRRFKSGWGATESIIGYYKYDLQKNTFVKDIPTIKPVHNKILRKMPISILKAMGSLLYKHIG